MIIILAVVLSTVLALIAALHFYWAFGGRRGIGAVVPTKPATLGGLGEVAVFNPGPITTAVVAVLLGVAALVPLAASGFISMPVPNALIRFGIWALAAVLLVRAVGDFRFVGFTKRVRGTPFAEADSRLYTPLCIGLSALAFAIALGSA